MFPGFSLASGGGPISGASSPGDVYVTPTVTIGGIQGSPFGNKGLSGLDPVTLIAGAVIVGTLVWILVRGRG